MHSLYSNMCVGTLPHFKAFSLKTFWTIVFILFYFQKQALNFKHIYRLKCSLKVLFFFDAIYSI